MPLPIQESENTKIWVPVLHQFLRCADHGVFYFMIWKLPYIAISTILSYHEMLFTFYTPAPRRRRGYTVLPLSVCPSVRPSFRRSSVQDIFRRIFLSNCWWQKSDIWSQASHRYTILWATLLDPSDSYLLFADLVGFYTLWTYMHIFVTFFTATIDGRNLIFGHKLHIGTPYRGKSFWTHQIPTSCLPILLIFIHI